MGTAEISTEEKKKNQNPSEFLQNHASGFLHASHTLRSSEVEFCIYENGNNVKIDH